MQISARKKDWPKEKPSVSIDYPMPANLDDLRAFCGDETVYHNAVDSITISIQAAMRRILDAPAEKKSDEQKQKEIEALVNYKPSTGNVTRRSPTERIEDLTSKMSPEERAALIQKLQEQLAAA